MTAPIHRNTAPGDVDARSNVAAPTERAVPVQGAAPGRSRDDRPHRSEEKIAARNFAALQGLRGAVVVLKYGGAAMGDPELAGAWAQDVALLRGAGVRVVVVHGGGPALTRTMARMGIESTFVEGHRVTSAEGAEVAEMVLSGRINKEVVSLLNRAGARAIGLSGTDGGILRVTRRRPGGRDIGFVGDVDGVEAAPIRLLLDNGYVPVLSSTAADAAGQTHNINADLVAAAIAGALGASRLIFLSDVPGVLIEGRRAPHLSAAQVRALLGQRDDLGRAAETRGGRRHRAAREDAGARAQQDPGSVGKDRVEPPPRREELAGMERPGPRSDAGTTTTAAVVSGGMRPKLESALAALDAGVPRVDLVDGGERHAVLDVLLEDAMGTRLTPDAARATAPPPAITAPEDGGSGQASVGGPSSPCRPSAMVTVPDASWAGTLVARGSAAVMNTYARYPLELVSGRGCRVTDSAGRSYLDFVAGIAVNVLGHGHPAVVRALRAASDGPLHVSNLYWTEPMVSLSERLTRASGMEKAFFCNSGAEAVETALKIARRVHPSRERIVAFDRSFHGRTLGALSATFQSAYQDPFRPLLPGMACLPFGDFDAASSAIDETTAAVLVEPVQGEGGVRPAPRGWLEHLRRLCDRSGALLVLDEVQTGLGRTGTLFAFEQAGIRPDAVACAKALAGGLPMGALLATGKAAVALGPGQHGSTFGGGPFVASVANAVLDIVLAPGFLEDVRTKGERLGAMLDALASEHAGLVAEARGRGLMWGLALRGPRAPELVDRLREAGLLAVPAGKDVLRLIPPLIVTAPEIDEAAGLIDEALGALGATAAGAETRAHDVAAPRRGAAAMCASPAQSEAREFDRGTEGKEIEADREAEVREIAADRAADVRGVAVDRKAEIREIAVDLAAEVRETAADRAADVRGVAVDRKAEIRQIAVDRKAEVRDVAVDRAPAAPSDPA